MSDCDVLFVASNLNVVMDRYEETALPERSIGGLVFRALNPMYYAWLRSKIDVAALATDARELSMEAYDTLLGKFDEIHRWATHAFGKEALRQAMGSLDVNRYRAPSEKTLADCVASVHKFPKEGSWALSQPIAPRVLELVDGIASEALALGWSKASLYQNRGNVKFPCGKDWGLVCFIREGDRIGSVTSTAIEIIGAAPGANPLKFYNPDRKVEQLNLFAKGAQQ
jgi:hypothetical protein